MQHTVCAWCTALITPFSHIHKVIAAGFCSAKPNHTHIPSKLYWVYMSRIGAAPLKWFILQWHTLKCINQFDHKQVSNESRQWQFRDPLKLKLKTIKYVNHYNWQLIRSFILSIESLLFSVSFFLSSLLFLLLCPLVFIWVSFTQIWA